MEEADAILLLSLITHLTPYASLFTLTKESTSEKGVAGMVERKEVYALCRILLDTCNPDNDKSVARLEKARGDHTLYSLEKAKGVAKRHKFCTEVAEGIKALGYDGDCGYNTLLYPTVNATRGLLQFLVRKLPVKEDAVQAGGKREEGGDEEVFDGNQQEVSEGGGCQHIEAWFQTTVYGVKSGRRSETSIIARP